MKVIVWIVCALIAFLAGIGFFGGALIIFNFIKNITKSL